MVDMVATTAAVSSRLSFANTRSNAVVEHQQSSTTTTTFSSNAEGITVTLSESSRSYYYSFTSQAPVAAVNATEPTRQTPQQTANNILQSIRDKLEEADENGADRKELRSLLKDGYRGFKKGFREAVKTLDHSDNLDKDLKSELKNTRKLVREGVRDLRHEFLPRRHHHHHHHHDRQTQAVVASASSTSSSLTVSSGGGAEGGLVEGKLAAVEDVSAAPGVALPVAESNETPAAASTGPSTMTPSVVDDPGTLVEGKGETETEGPATTVAPSIIIETSFSEQSSFSKSMAMANRNTLSELQGLSQSISATYNRNQSALIEITTLDGDVLTIDLTMALEASKAFNSQGAYDFKIGGSSDSSFLIEGEMDEGEIAALNELLIQVDGLANQFFNGDISAAFEQAQRIGFDSGEIASFSLAFSQSTSVTATNTYLENDGSEGAREQIRKNNGFSSLGNYVSSIRDALQSAQAFSQPANLLSSLLSTNLNISGEEIPAADVEKFVEINDTLIQGIEVLE